MHTLTEHMSNLLIAQAFDDVALDTPFSLPVRQELGVWLKRHCSNIHDSHSSLGVHVVVCACGTLYILTVHVHSDWGDIV